MNPLQFSGTWTIKPLSEGVSKSKRSVAYQQKISDAFTKKDAAIKALPESMSLEYYDHGQGTKGIYMEDHREGGFPFENIMSRRFFESAQHLVDRAVKEATRFSKIENPSRHTLK